MPGRLATAVDAAGLRTGDVVRPLLAALDDAGAAASTPHRLALVTRSVAVADGRISLVLEGRRIPDDIIQAVTS